MNRMQNGEAIPLRLAPTSEQDPYLNWRESSALIYNFIHFYTAPSRVNHSSLQWLDFKPDIETKNESLTKLLCLSTRKETSKKEASKNQEENSIELLSIEKKNIIPGALGLGSVSKLKRTGLLAASTLQSISRVGVFHDQGSELRNSCTSSYLYAASDFKNTVSIWKLNRALSSKEPLLLRLSCSQVKLSQGIGFTANNLLCTGASLLGTPSFAVWDLETSAKIPGSSTPSSLGMIQGDQPSNLTDISLGSDPNLFYGVTDSSHIVRWDSRESSVAHAENSHSGPAVSISLNPLNENIFATGGIDKLIKVWDTRKMATPGKAEPIQIIHGHTKPIKKIEWAPYCEKLIASSSEDATVRIFSSNGEQLLVHLGHRNPIESFSWCNWSKAPLTIASADYDSKCGGSTVQIWGFDESIVESHMALQSLRLGRN